MKTMSATLTDVLKSLMQALRISSVLPATVFVVLNCLLFFPNLTTCGLDAQPVVPLVVIAVLVLSYLLYAFNAPLIRLIEGYPYRLECLGQILAGRQRAQYKHCLNEMERAERKIREINARQGYLAAERGLTDPTECPTYEKLEDWKREWQIRRNAARQTLYYHYPDPVEGEAEIVPTLLGNTIASFERYPYDRYGIDAVIMWPRLVPILQDQHFIPFVENEKTVFDFLLNLSFLTLLLAIEAGLCLAPAKLALFSLLALISVAYILYRAAVMGAVNWGGTVQVAFDLYRGHLRESLELREPHSLHQEREIWRRVSRFYTEGGSFEGFNYDAGKEPTSYHADKPERRNRKRGCWLWQRIVPRRKD